jgi:hypothetical protein
LNSDQNNGSKSNNLNHHPNSSSNNTQKDNQNLGHRGQVKLLDLTDFLRTDIIQFMPHPCTKSCVAKWENCVQECKSINPLLKPLFHGWQRLRSKQSRSVNENKKWITYVAPCGRSLRSTNEVDLYLEKTDSKLTIDMFCFDQCARIDREFESETKNVKIDDMTKGSETMPISCVNNINDDEPFDFSYWSNSIPLEGVPLNRDPAQLEGNFVTDEKKSQL